MRILGKFLLGTLLVLPGCFGATPASAPNHPDQFALSSCSLGCSGTTCAVNSISTNQPITLVFNDKIDPATVSLTELSIIDITSGATPPVEFSVSGNQIIVRPTLFETEAGLTFGFEEDGIYRIQLFADPFTNVIRSVIGRPNITTLDCNIATSGITDLVPGRPQVIFTPDASTPPTSSDFVVTMVFTDLMQKAQLVNSPYGTSPTIGVQIIDDTQSSTIAVNVPGTFDVKERR